MRNKNLLALIILLSTLKVSASDSNVDFNKDWKFVLKDSAHYSYTSYVPGDEWKKVNLPHDWSVGLPYDSISGEGCVAFLQGGIGWYSKSFPTTISANQKCYIVFDGVYNNSEYWINGKKLGYHPSGYAPFYFDVTDYLNPNEDNRMTVRVDHSHYADSRWYTGSGIYRDVKMIVTDRLHIPVWGTFVTTPVVTDKYAKVNNQITVRNSYSEPRTAVVEIVYKDNKGNIAAFEVFSIKLNAGEEKIIDIVSEIKQPDLWSVEIPVLYTAETRIKNGDEVISENTVRFGIRTFHFDADKGFFLNGKNMKIKGVCLHHDAGIVGTAMIRDVWYRRLKTLKEGGCNAIRLSHNPGADEFLSLCDEIGLLVQEEFFDEWDYPKDKRLNMKETVEDYPTHGYCEHFQEWAERDLKNVMRRSRNHACIFQWSIGNEIEWTYTGCREATGFFGADSNGNYFWNQPPYSKEKIREMWKIQPKHAYDIGRTAQKLAAWTRQMDTTRVVTANCILPSISFESGYIDALDVAGFSYRRVMYDYAKKNYPDKPIMGTENLGQWHEWKAVIERDFVPGMFIWTGVDYLGESGSRLSRWPQKSIGCGLLDMCGYVKPSYDMMKSLWTDKPFIAIYSQTTDKSSYLHVKDGFTDKKGHEWDRRLWVWDDVNSHWNYQKGDSVIVEIYSNCDEVELFVNGKSMGKKYIDDFEDHIYKWAVQYKPGTITAKGKNKLGNTTTAIRTSGKEHSILLTVDKQSIAANGKDVLHVTAQLTDKKGNPVKTTEQMLKFNIDGEYRLLGIDNGNVKNVSPYQSKDIMTYQGRCMLMLQSTEKSSVLNISAETSELHSNKLTINIK